jgi:hypothetical protein
VEAVGAGEETEAQPAHSNDSNSGTSRRVMGGQCGAVAALAKVVFRGQRLIRSQKTPVGGPASKEDAISAAF